MVSRSSLEINSFSLLIENQVHQLNLYLSSLHSLLSHLDSRFDQLSYSLTLAKQQLKSLNLEISRTQQFTVDLKLKLTPETCLEISKIKNPNTTLVNLAENFLVLLNQPEQSWKIFREIMKTPEKLRQISITMEAESLTSEQIDRSIHIWKNQHNILQKIKKYPKGVRVLSELVSVIIQLKIKKDSFDDCFDEYLSYKKKVSILKEKITEINTKILKIQEKIQELKRANLGKTEENETSDSSFCSPICTQKVRVSSNIFGRETASGGILGGGEGEMPQGEEVDEYFSGKGNEVSFEIFYDNSEIGCCRSKFFCF